MQRAPCSCSSTSGSVRTNSRWSETRSAGGRSGVSTRANFLKPPTSPIRSGLLALRLAREDTEAAGRDRPVAVFVERAAVVVRHHLHEAGPRCEHALGERRARALQVLLHECPHELRVAGVERLEPDELRVAASRERVV